MSVVQPEMFSEWECETCHDTGRIFEVWNATKANRFGTAGKSYKCPHGCRGRLGPDWPHERVIHHKDKS